MLDDNDGAEEEIFNAKAKNQAVQESKKKRKQKPLFVDGNIGDRRAEKGIATHNFMQFFSVDNFDKNGVEDELSRLIKLGFISKETGDLVEKSEIELFLKSDLFREMKNSKKSYREFRFNTHLPARYFNFEEKILAKITDEELLVQGVIDCILEDSDGELHLVDYKTDRLTKEELTRREAAERKLNESHAPQLSCYALAIEKIFGKKPKSVRVYSLPLGDTVDIKLINFDKI
jgi:ATP-dependent helicase/nuclease subunit A